MSDYVNLVICQFERNPKYYLFYAPAWTDFEEGQRVSVETANGAKEAAVKNYCTVEKDSNEFKIIKALCGANGELKRVIGKLELHEFFYPNENEEVKEDE